MTDAAVLYKPMTDDKRVTDDPTTVYGLTTFLPELSPD